MMVQDVFYMLILSACMASSSCDLSAMRRSSSEDDLLSDDGAIARVVAAPVAVVLGAHVADSKLPDHQKAMLYGVLSVVGAYGIEWYQPPTKRSSLFTSAETVTALLGMSYIVSRLDVPVHLKRNLYIGFASVSLWRLCAALGKDFHAK